ncbi:MAG: hypothetical protein KDA92_24340, partial [Planctomycetales bacterium]|nr:hypothetical protein [Planctomycetales bacterium]
MYRWIANWTRHGNTNSNRPKTVRQRTTRPFEFERMEDRRLMVGDFDSLTFSFNATTQTFQGKASFEQPSDAGESSLRIPVAPKNTEGDVAESRPIRAGDSIAAFVTFPGEIPALTAELAIVAPDGTIIRPNTHPDGRVVVMSPMVFADSGDYMLQSSIPLGIHVEFFINYASPDVSNETLADASLVIDPTTVTETSVSTAAVIGSIRSYVSQPLVTWNAATLARMETDVKDPSSSIWIDDSRPLPALVLETGDNPESKSRIGGGVIIDYDSTTGNVSLSAQPDPLVVLEIKSANGLFTENRPALIDSGPFNVYNSNKVFVFDYVLGDDIGGGFRQLDFGPILPPGKTQAELIADLSIAGAHRNLAGALRSPQIRVDLDPEISNQGYAGASGTFARLLLEEPVTNANQLLVRYHTETTNGGDYTEQAIVNRLYLTSDGGANWPRSQVTFPACIGECQTLVGIGNKRVDGIAFISFAAHNRWVIDSIEALQRIDSSTYWYKLTLNPGEAAQATTTGLRGYWFDENENFVAAGPYQIANSTDAPLDFYFATMNDGTTLTPGYYATRFSQY